MDQAISMVYNSLNIDPVNWAFKDFSIADKFYTIRIIKNKGSKRFSIYNDER